jgi:hypothetical protein
MTTPLLEIKNATKVYGGGFLRGGPTTVALQGFNLTIEARPATITTIAGESGQPGAGLCKELIRPDYL